MELEVKDLHKSFSGKEVLHGITFKVKSGKALGLLGRNGAGKTTTIRILMNLFEPNSGEILMNGEKFLSKDYKIGYLPEERGLYPKKKVLEQLIYLGQLRGFGKKTAKESALNWLKKLQVDVYKDKKLDTLSKGNQQKVQLAQTFMCDPDIVILDEPFSGLDPVNAQILKDIIKEIIEQKKILIFSSHQMSYVEEFCEDIALIDKGEIVLDGNLKDIKNYYGNNRLVVNLAGDVQTQKDVFERELRDVVSVDDVKKDHVILKLSEGKTKHDLLNKIVSLGLDLNEFAPYEPTLEDIFVKKVGDVK